MDKKLKSYQLAAITFMFMVTGAAQADTTIGRWCDKMLPTMPQFNGIMEIVITDSGSIELRTRYGDGSSVINKLEEQRDGFYTDIESTHGDKFRIILADGNLQLLDNDGLIRVAIRLENTPQPGECGM